MTLNFGETKFENGQIMPMAAILLIPLLAFAGLAIDLGAVYYRASQLQSASDLAALAAAEFYGQGGDENQLDDYVKEIFEANGLDPNIVQVSTTRDGNEVAVSVLDNKAPVTFSSLFIGDVQIERGAKATTGDCYGVCDETITVSPPVEEIDISGYSGDGFAPTVVTDNGETKFFVLNHHEPSNQYLSADVPKNLYENNNQGPEQRKQLKCASLATNAMCDGYPVRLDTATYGITQPLWHEPNNQIWYPIVRPNYPNLNTATTEADLKGRGYNLYRSRVRRCSYRLRLRGGILIRYRHTK